MWTRVGRTVSVLTITVLMVVAAAPLNVAADRVCAAAEGHLEAGSLDRAKKLYESVKPADDERNCAVKGLQLVAAARHAAAELVTDGEQLIRSGHLNRAERMFRVALKVDAANAGAVAGIARVADLESRPLPTAASNWDRFYGDWVLPVGRLVLFSTIGLLVLGAIAGLSSMLWVKVGSVAWPTGARRTAKGVGCALLVSAAIMTPLFAMFNPFTPTWMQCWIAALVIFVIGLVAGFLLWWGTRQSRFLDWLALLVSLGVLVVAAIVILMVPIAYETRLMAAHIALALIGVVLTSAAFGQNLRLQVEVQQPDGNVNAAATDYLLARMKGLGTETPKGLERADSALATTPLSKISNEELSVLPAGNVVGALSRLFFALRPGLTWRARVTLVDDNRVATAVSRNGRHAASAVFSRMELGLPVDTDQDRARAQMLTGAAAFVLVHLSEVHQELKEDLCGARKWKSVALLVIAKSKSLLENEDRSTRRVDLLSRATDKDPGNVLARFEYLWAGYANIPHEETNYASFARTLDTEYERAGGLQEKLDEEEGWVPLKIRVLYSRTTQWINAYEAAREKGTHVDVGVAAYLQNAKKSADELQRLCTVSWNRKELQRKAEEMRPFAENLQLCIDALNGVNLDNVPEGHSHKGANPSPRLTYDHACLHMFLASQLPRRKRKQQRENALDDLQFALVTERDRKDAAADPCFRELRSDERFRQLVHDQPPQEFLDLPAFVGRRVKLEEVGVTTVGEVIRHTRTTQLQEQLAAHLEVSAAIVQQMRDVALLAQVHEDLSDPRMLHVLLSAGITSREALCEAARRDESELLHLVETRASEEHLTSLAGVKKPQLWLTVVKRKRCPWGR
ncbi:hypothetical protein Snoj_26620 [Streptomyces nojiriensis]|uniref:Uncharacterized protein n=1 Tax=Streptomyces nojiriensis TaxID=66374 RepID=A0ABQ3SKS4_9ACTN|nr:DUF4332 domain-containing protein [Streptomyces nojiriensis]QTI50324.1 hypothetical protein JYK04_08201 [Streptomyces nojiriensis]GGS29980.1 hypothetical protein GCM10010205_70220 [Streptomyces nojiriensis]GHI68744.1 hypothetical protein Snoj_26620 [Streptomyces nojiriensis]